MYRETNRPRIRLPPRELIPNKGSPGYPRVIRRHLAYQQSCAHGYIVFATQSNYPREYFMPDTFLIRRRRRGTVSADYAAAATFGRGYRKFRRLLLRLYLCYSFWDTVCTASNKTVKTYHV